MPHKAKMCLEILDKKLEEYIQTHKEWDAKGYLCPHTGNPKAHDVMDEIMEDVQLAHDMLEIALHRAGISHDAMHYGAHKPEQPTHAGATSAPGARPVPA
jgi:hypothetical protein